MRVMVKPVADRRATNSRLARRRRNLRRTVSIGAWLLAAVLPNAPLRAADLLQEDGFDLRWDNTLRYTAAFRLFPSDESLLYDPNADDGDRNFVPGLVSDRIDILTELDLSKGGFGLHASAAAWYDTVYQARNANNSPSTFNPVSVPYDEFTRATRRLDGDDAELLDAFLYGSFEFGGMPVTFRLGRHTLLWGESLFFASNGIAGGQAPIDEIKDLSQPDIEAKELYLPVGQFSATIQPLSNVTLSFYYQFEWEKTRFPGSGSYFSDVDYFDAGGERLIVQPGEYLYRAQDRTPPASGQYGIALQSSVGEIDYGFYALRYNAKEPQIFLLPGIATGPGGTLQITDSSIVDLAAGRIGDYEFVYPKGIDIYGASFAFYLGDNAIAGEISARRNMPLVSGLTGLPGIVGGGYGGGTYAALERTLATPYTIIQPDTSYAVGDTLHGQLSDIATLSPGRFWDGAQLSIEVAANDLLSVTSDPYSLDPSRTKFAAAFRAVFAPEYFEILPNLDVTVPIGMGYGLIGRSSTDGSQNAGAGDIEFGVSATYRAVWKGAITLTHFVGGSGTQPLGDRDFASISVQRTF